jgi:signal transduction histidine kinase
MKDLSDARPASAANWQRHLSKCLSSVLSFCGQPLERMGVLTGSGAAGEPKRFRLAGMNSRIWWTTSQITLQNQSLPTAVFAPGELPEEIVPAVGHELARKKYFLVFGYEHLAANDGLNVCTLVVVQAGARPDPASVDFLRMFCDNLARRDAISRLFLWQCAAYEEFETHVTDIAHDLKTSVQHIVGQSEKLVRWARGLAPDKAPSDHASLDPLAKSVEEHASLISRLHAPGSQACAPQLESIDVFALLRLEVEVYTPVAEKASVRLMVESMPATPGLVVCERADLMRGFGSLLDNAIKYSYHDNRFVSISATCTQQRATIAIENYGIGIPPDKLARLKTRGFRGSVPDPLFDRLGTGKGVAIAAKVFEQILGGTLVFQSCPASVNAVEDRPFHRYLTKVTITVPVEKG